MAEKRKLAFYIRLSDADEEVKAGTKDEELAKEFLDHFCKINAIKFDDLPVLEGALTR